MAKLEVVYHDTVGKVLHVKVAKAPPALDNLSKLLPSGCGIVAVRASTDFRIWLVEYDVLSVASNTQATAKQQFEALLADEQAFNRAVRQSPLEALFHISVGVVLVALAVWFLNH